MEDGGYVRRGRGSVVQVVFDRDITNFTWLFSNHRFTCLTFFFSLCFIRGARAVKLRYAPGAARRSFVDLALVQRTHARARRHVRVLLYKFQKVERISWNVFGNRNRTEERMGIAFIMLFSPSLPRKLAWRVDIHTMWAAGACLVIECVAAARFSGWSWRL